MHLPYMTTIPRDVLACPGLPHSYRTQIGRRSNILPIRRPHHRSNAVIHISNPFPIWGDGKTEPVAVGHHLVPSGRIPGTNCFFQSARGDVYSIRGPRYTTYTAGMPTIGEHMLTCGRLPDLHRVVREPSSRSYRSSIGGPRHYDHNSSMTSVREHMRTTE